LILTFARKIAQLRNAKDFCWCPLLDSNQHGR